MGADSSLGPRVFSAALFLPLLALVVWAGGPWYLGYCAVLLAFALLELYRLGRDPLPVWVCALGVVAVVLRLLQDATPGFASSAAMPGSDLWVARRVHGFGLLGFVVAMLSWDVLRGRVSGSLARAGRALFGYAYVTTLGSYLLYLRMLDGPRELAGRGSGLAAVALAYSLVWIGDTAAYAVGTWRGRHPLAPGLSPKKTWEGAAGGFLGSIAAGAVAGATCCVFLGPLRGALLGALTSVAGQIGDLAESMMKRDAGAKDSASWIPGHGGVLDRFDSLLFAAPVVYHFLLWNATH